MLRGILNKSWRAKPHKTPTVRPPAPCHENDQVRRTRHVGHCWRSRDELIRDVLLWTPTHGRANQTTSTTYIQQLCEIRDVVPKTYLGRWTIGRSGERVSGISILPAWYDDDDDVLSNYAALWTQSLSVLNKRVMIKPIITQPSQQRLENTLTASLHWSKAPPPTSVLDMTVNQMMARLQPWRYGGNVEYPFIIFTNPSARAGYDTRSIFNAEFNRFEFRVFLLLD